jgi:hypothetical protein
MDGSTIVKLYDPRADATTEDAERGVSLWGFACVSAASWRQLFVPVARLNVPDAVAKVNPRLTQSRATAIRKQVGLNSDVVCRYMDSVVSSNAEINVVELNSRLPLRDCRSDLDGTRIACSEEDESVTVGIALVNQHNVVLPRGDFGETSSRLFKRAK